MGCLPRSGLVLQSIIINYDNCPLLKLSSVKEIILPVRKSKFCFLLPLLRKMSSVNFMSTIKVENGCGGTSTFFPFHLTSFILRAFDSQLTLCRTKRVVEVDQTESRKPFSLRSNTVLTSTTTMLWFYVFILMPQQQALNLQITAYPAARQRSLWSA